MEITIPVYVAAERQRGTKQLQYACQPLFFEGVSTADLQLGKAMTELTRQLKQRLDGLGAQPRHDDLAQWGYAPEMSTHLLKLKLDLRTRIAKCRLLFVTFEALGRRIGFTPTLPSLWFELDRGETLAARATDVLTRHFRQTTGKRDLPLEDPASPEAHTLAGQAWVTTITIDVSTRLPKPEQLEKKFAQLFDESQMDGGVELQRVGRCLNWLYPDELSRAVLREREVGELQRLLSAEDKRPIALVGPRLGGKTAVLHEHVYRTVAQRKHPYSARENVWLLSPQRLISGMSFVGQWENRLLAILREAKRRRHVLFFDDFLGLYHAGISRDASLSAAEVLKPFIHRRDVRIVAEFTTEAWHALEERDRGLSDQFHVIPIPATDDDETLRIMLAVQRQQEAEHRVAFALDALPTILELERRYVRDAAFPGKSAAFSRQLARKYAGKVVARDHVFSEFHERTGLSLALLDRRQKLTRDDVLRQLRQKIVGQEEAVAACADVISTAKAGLNAPGRPLATLLFLGPTGVGKTECAKALAEVLFTSSSRLLRFDMNEYVTPHAVAQLVGTFEEPDGLLSGAVRRQPFAVILLDEIEKAHPDVFDLLLQVTGEGRLTDAIGRTADFSNCVIVMTSNLGVAATGRRIGLRDDPLSRRQVFVKAAEGFFRPEFFNRIDRVVPFSALARNEMEQIAQLVLQRVFQRDGLVRRRCALDITPPALERIVDAGYHPQYGARALKRSIEQQLLQPVAATLAGVRPELPAVIGVYPHGAGITAHVQPLESVAPATVRPASVSPAVTYEQAIAYLERVEDELDETRPSTSVSARGMSREQLKFFALKEQLHRVREAAQLLRDHLRNARPKGLRVETAPVAKSFTQQAMKNQRNVGQHRMLLDVHAAHDIHAFLQDVATSVPAASDLATAQEQILDEATLLTAMQTSSGPEDVVLCLRPTSAQGAPMSHHLALNLQHLYGNLLGFDATIVYDRDLYTLGIQAIHVSGPGVWNLLAPEQGVHLVCRRHEHLLPVQLSLLATQDKSPVETILNYGQQRYAWLAGLANGTAQATDDPHPLGQVVRIYDEKGTVDLRTGLAAPRIPTSADLRRWLCAGLPLPAELRGE